MNAEPAILDLHRRQLAVLRESYPEPTGARGLLIVWPVIFLC